MNSISKEKQDLRELLLQRRVALDEAQRVAADQQIRQTLLSLPEIRSANALFCFVSFRDEVDTHTLISRLLESGKQVAVPGIFRQIGMQAIPFTAWEDLQPGELGILSPIASTPAAFPIDVCITPGVGFTCRGDRLGYGKGYYDRWFAANPVKLKIAIAYECQIVDELPADESDIAVDYIVTENRLIRTAEYHN